MQDQLLSPTFLFRFSAACLYRKKIWSADGIQLEQKYTLPCFGELEDRPMFADLRGAWSEAGLTFTVRVSGKKQMPWCRAARLEDSDGLHVWIDTRDTHNIHRASRFCHRFVFTPTGDGPRSEEPATDLLHINRARDDPKLPTTGVLQVRSEKRVDGYVLAAHIPAEAITGFDPQEHPKLGFSYAVIDRELGWQTFSVGPEFPFVEDPSLWGTLELVR